MSKPFSRFGPDMKRLSKRVEVGAQKLLAEGVVAIGSDLARQTPIDTGRASGNWQGSVGVPIMAESGVFYPSSSIGQMQLLRASALSSAGNPSIFLTNMVPYMHLLNRGWSMQAPTPFWIERTIIRNLRITVTKGQYKILR